METVLLCVGFQLNTCVETALFLACRISTLTWKQHCSWRIGVESVRCWWKQLYSWRVGFKINIVRWKQLCCWRVGIQVIQHFRTWRIRFQQTYGTAFIGVQDFNTCSGTALLLAFSFLLHISVQTALLLGTGFSALALTV